MATRTLVLGGVRSGKSLHAEQLAGHAEDVDFVATALTDSSDREWRNRITEHRIRRPDHWRTVEPERAADVVTLLEDAPPEATLLIDELGTWLSRLIDEESDWDSSDLSDVVHEHTLRLSQALAECTCRVVLVSPEVGMGVVPETPSGRRFRDLLGILNSRVAQHCQHVLLMVAGRVIPLTDPADGIAPAQRPEQAERPQQHESHVAQYQPPPPTPQPTPGHPGSTAARSAEEEPVAEDDEALLAVRFPEIQSPDIEAKRQAVARHFELTKPAGSLGRLEELGVWLASCQASCPPRAISRPAVVIFAGDHGVASDGVSAYPSEVTAQMVSNFLAGGAAVNVLSGLTGAQVRIADMAVRHPSEEWPESVSANRVCAASGVISREDALSERETLGAIAAGRAIAIEEIEAGADLLIPGDMGIGNTTPAAVLVAAMTGTEPVAVIGRGTGIDDRGWMRKAAAVRDALRRASPVAGDPVALLRTAGGADIAAISGYLAEAAARQVPVLLDGLVVCAAAMVAEELAPGAAQWWQSGHLSAEPAHAIALEHLGKAPLLALDMRLGEASGATAALPLVLMAGQLLSGMATFSEAAVSTGTPSA